MTHDDDIDRILGAEPEIVPSATFTASVMKAVRQQAATPPPIAFPWNRALPGLVTGALALVLAAVRLPANAQAGTAAPFAWWVSLFSRLLEATTAAGGHWALLAVLLTLASVRLSKALARAGWPARS